MHAKTMSSRPLRLVLLAPACLLVVVSAPLAAQQIYKWTDKNGNVHYSDRPSPSIDAEKIHLKPGADEANTAAASETAKRIEETGKALEASRKAREAALAKEQEARRKAQEERAQSNAKIEENKPLGESWYRGIYTGPPPRRPARPPARPHGPTATPLPPDAPAGLR